MKFKNLRKKIQRLEKRLREGPKKLAKLKQKLQAAEAAKAMKASRKSAARAARGTKTSASVGKMSKPTPTKKAKRKLNLSPERRAQLSAAMKARWAAKKAAQAGTTTNSPDQNSAQGTTPPRPENRPDGA
jgi:predicted RNase H-like nuclease (RuvC/YqgF family)